MVILTGGNNWATPAFDPKVKGLFCVLIVPGGSATSRSEAIRAELAAAWAAGSLWVVSMGGMAASGWLRISTTSQLHCG